MSDLPGDVAAFMAEVERLCADDPDLSPLAAAILAGLSFGIAHDSRSFAGALGIEHALVLREVQALIDIERLTATGRDQRTQRCRYAPAPSSKLRPPVDMAVS